MKQVLKYPGAKTRLAPWICSYIPAHKVYLEPFFGSGAVFFNKQLEEFSNQTKKQIKKMQPEDGQLSLL